MEKKVKKVTDYEKKVKEVNDSMSSVLKKKRELEDSHRKQEVLINKIKKIDEGNKASVAGLSKKKEEEEAKETNKFESLVADLDAQRKELTTKKANLPLGTLTYADKKAFIQSEAGQALMEKMNSQTLKTNAEKLMDEVDDLLTTKRVMDIDPADEYSETATILVNTYSWSGGGANEEPTGHFFEAPASYSITYSDNVGSGKATWTDLSPNEEGHLVFEHGSRTQTLRPHADKVDTFEFRHSSWEDYGLQEWIVVDGFSEGTQISFNINTGKAIETYDVTFVPVDGSGDGANTVTHLVEKGTYSYSYAQGQLAGVGVNTNAANDGFQTTLNVGSWLISPDPTAKNSSDFIAQEVIVDEETGKESYGLGIPIGQFSNDSISWTIAAEKEGAEDTVHTVTYQNPSTSKGGR